MIRSPRSSAERRLALAALLLAGLAVAGGAPAAAQSGAQSGVVPPAEVRARARAALEDPRFQRSLPSHEEADDPRRRRRVDETGATGGDLPEVSLPVLGAGAILGKVIFIVLLVAAGVLILGWIAHELLARRRGADPRTGPEAEASPAPLREKALVFDDASRLAGQGRYAEAVHALLLAAIRHFAERSRTAIQPSRTSRELVLLLPLGPEAREAFAELVRTVELSLFGGAAVGAEDYERNLARFQALTRRSA
ncbi:MAG: DUF4129 domain-containing protein [Thermoanaerobaculia bacterium]